MQDDLSEILDSPVPPTVQIPCGKPVAPATDSEGTAFPGKKSPAGGPQIHGPPRPSRTGLPVGVLRKAIRTNCFRMPNDKAAAIQHYQ